MKGIHGIGALLAATLAGTLAPLYAATQGESYPQQPIWMVAARP